MELRSTKSVETNKSELTVAVSPEEFGQAVDAVYHRESRKLNIPGFRKGHAPRAFIEKYYGPEVFYQAAVDHLYRDMVTWAVDESGLKVVAVTNVSVDEVGKDQGVTATITVVTKPEAVIEGYRDMEIHKEPVVVTDGDIDQEIQRVRERNSRTVTVEDRPAEAGDIAVIDYEGSVDGVPFDGGKGENFELTLGSGQFIPGFEDQVAGHKTGEEFEITVTFPEDYHAQELKGKEAVFKVTLHEIKKKELPEVDDEFVKDVSEFDTLADYREDLRKSLLSRLERAADDDVERQIVDAVVDKVQAEIPDEMVENETDEMINSFEYQLRSQGLKLETYLKYTGMSTDDLRAQYKPQAERQVKLRLGLEKIAQLEKLEPTEDETRAEYQRLAEQYGMEVDQVKNLIRAEDLNQDIRNKKAVDFLRENAKIIEPEKLPEEKPDKPAKKAAAKKAPAKKEGESAEAAPAGETPDEKPAPKKRAAKKKEEPKAEEPEG